MRAGTTSRLARVSSTQIYSIQKVASPGVFNEIHAANYRQAKEMLATPDSTDPFMRNEFGAVQYSRLEISRDKKALPSKVVRPVANTSPLIIKDPAKAVPIRTTSATPSADKGVKESVLKSSAVKSFFHSAGSSASAATKPVAAQAKPIPAKKAIDSEDNINEDGEWDDGSNYETNKINLQKRKPELGVFEERPEIDSNHADMEIAEDGDQLDGSPSIDTFKGKFRVYGAMDSFIEDAAIAEHKREQAAGSEGAKPSAAASKRRKLVEKVRPSTTILCMQY